MLRHMKGALHRLGGHLGGLRDARCSLPVQELGRSRQCRGGLRHQQLRDRDGVGGPGGCGCPVQLLRDPLGAQSGYL